MDSERIYIVEWRCFGDKFPSREIVTATSIPQLFNYYIDMANIVEFAFEDVTESSVEETERRLTYNGKYAM